MLHPAIEILNSCRLMAISTVRPDGWPQTTFVGYVNEGWALYFQIFRSSQKFANIAQDDRVSIAVSKDVRSLAEAKAVYAGAHASEVTDPAEQARAWALLVEHHPNLAEAVAPDLTATALMRADCKYVSLLDYSKGLGHREALTVGETQLD